MDSSVHTSVSSIQPSQKVPHSVLVGVGITCVWVYWTDFSQLSYQWKENQISRVKTYEELDKLIKHKNIINHIKAQRLSWFGHIQRMPDTRTVKKIYNWKPLTKRSQGRPKRRWEDNITQDICQMKIKNWIACVQDGGK